MGRVCMCVCVVKGVRTNTGGLGRANKGQRSTVCPPLKTCKGHGGRRKDVSCTTVLIILRRPVRSGQWGWQSSKCEKCDEREARRATWRAIRGMGRS